MEGILQAQEYSEIFAFIIIFLKKLINYLNN